MLKTPLMLLQKFEDDQYCQFCDKNVVDTLLYGPIYKYEKIIAHYFCLLLASNIRQNGTDAEGILGFLPEDIEKELARGRKLSCSYCRKKGASIGCVVKSCRTQFHLPCGIAKEALSLFYDHYPSYCYKHRSCISIPGLADEKFESNNCLICLENITLPLSSNIIWSTCCKNAWYHKRCIQEVAFNSGYYFRCPNCNSEKSFRKQMIDFGIYIPNQDASWEREPNAYSSFYERYDHCDASTCYCPWGRSKSRREGSWKIILCYRCLQKGIHKRCGKSLIKRDLWSCSSQACLDNNPRDAVVMTPETSSQIVTRSSKSPLSRRENKENFALNINASDPPSTSFLQNKRVKASNAPLVTKRPPKDRFIGRGTRANSSFAFNFPPVTSTNRRSLVEPTKRKRIRRRNLRFRVLRTNTEENKTGNNEVRRTKKYNQPKRGSYEANSQKDFLTGRRKRRYYIVEHLPVRVYPAEVKTLRSFIIRL